MSRASRVEDFVQSIDNPSLVLLGMEIWRASEVEAKKFQQDAGVSHPMLLNAHNVAKDYDIPTRNHFAVINGKGNVVYTSIHEPEYFKAWKEDEVRPVVEKALSQL